MVALRFFATGSFQLTLADLFGVSKATIHLCIRRVSDAIASKLHHHGRFGDQREADRTKAKFFAMAGMPSVIGCIDGTHIKVQRPREMEYQFVNRKGYHSMNVQLVCDAGTLSNLIKASMSATHSVTVRITVGHSVLSPM